MIFIAVAHVFSSLWQLIMGKVKVGLYFYLTADILTKKFYRNVPWVVLYQPYEFFSKLLNLIGCHGNQKAKFAHTKNQNHLLYRYLTVDILIKVTWNFAEMFVRLTVVFFIAVGRVLSSAMAT